MTVEYAEFQRILNAGLGRAILYLKNHDSTPYRDLILHACLHNTAYDPQVEGTRAEYMREIIQLTGEVDLFRNEILKAISDPNCSDWDMVHRLVHASLFAKEGDAQARQIIYDIALSDPTANLIYDVLIDMDGAKGLAALIDKIWETESPVRSELLWNNGDDLLRNLEYQDGADEAQNSLKQIAEANPRVKEFLDGALAFRLKQEQSNTKRLNPRKFAYDDIRNWISDPVQIKNPPIGFSTWGKYAGDADILQAANDLLSIPDEDVRHLNAYLQIFQNRMFPLNPSRLINWASQFERKRAWKPDGKIDYEIRVVNSACHALELVMDWEVRNLALSLIENPNAVGHAVGLLGVNFIDGDWQLIEELTQRPLEREVYHSLGMSVLDVYDSHPFPEAVPSLLNLYAFGPCSNCRRRFVERLYSLNAVPDRMLEECKYDCNHDIREWAYKHSNPAMP